MWWAPSGDDPSAAAGPCDDHHSQHIVGQVIWLGLEILNAHSKAIDKTGNQTGGFITSDDASGLFRSLEGIDLHGDRCPPSKETQGPGVTHIRPKQRPKMPTRHWIQRRSVA